MSRTVEEEGVLIDNVLLVMVAPDNVRSSLRTKAGRITNRPNAPCCECEGLCQRRDVPANTNRQRAI